MEDNFHLFVRRMFDDRNFKTVRELKTSLKKKIYARLKFIAVIPGRLICQMLVGFSGDDFLRTVTN